MYWAARLVTLKGRTQEEGLSIHEARESAALFIVLINKKYKAMCVSKMGRSQRLATSLFAVLMTGLLLFGLGLESNAKMFGKSFDSSHDYSCCQGGSLYIFHYYETKFFWFSTGSGYDQEYIGSGTCQYQCPAM
ncbi:hypothetical protein [Foetidibacter luteolus]|uniref:hypothetical protein n=1 Tax=Foetidibacter luteolus TaxID=2608880 RepID=UPI00129BBBD0|nr:hypothetical protein [Foetidibacter luteolus]